MFQTRTDNSKPIKIAVYVIHLIFLEYRIFRV